MHTFAITDPSAVAHARRALGALAAQIGFNAEDAGRAALVATEICSNMVKHAGTGVLLAQMLERDGRCGLELLGLDKGPGMTDVAKCLRDGFSTGSSPGTGLGAIGRLSQLFDIYSREHKGTAILSQIWPDGRAPQPRPLEIGAIVLPKTGETECGDAWCYAQRAGGVVVLAVDGLGHGLGAAQAAAAACEAFEQAKQHPLNIILQKMHVALRPTRGAAVMLVNADWHRGQLVAAGIGNVVAVIAKDDTTRRIPSDNGIVGHVTPRIRELSYELAHEAVLILHSDGLSTTWQAQEYPGLIQHHCALIAGVLYRDCQRGRDDCLVVVMRQGRS